MVNLPIHGISHDAAGVGKTESGKIVFVPGALPGETVQIGELIPQKRIYQAELEEVLKPHEKRVEPLCPLVGQCGGCALQHADADLQGELKTQIVKDALERIGNIKLPPQPILSMENPWRYRNKGIFHASYERGKTQLGFYAKGTHQLIPASACLLFSPAVNDLVAWLEEAITDTGQPYHISKVMIRESYVNKDLMVVFVTEDSNFKLKSLAPALAQYNPQVKSIWHNVCANPKLMLGRTFNHLYREKTIVDAIGKNRYELSPQSFFQVNTQQAKVLYDAVLTMTPWEKETALDLYCGIGTIGLHIADQVDQLIGVESVPQAIDDARENAIQNQIKNAIFYKDKAEKWLPNWVKEGKAIGNVILDPPRKGCDEKVLQAIRDAKVQTITYVSCNPATLARDLKFLVQVGYKVEAVQPVDMFPQTGHVETVVLMSQEGENLGTNGVLKEL